MNICKGSERFANHVYEGKLRVLLIVKTFSDDAFVIFVKDSFMRVASKRALKGTSE